VISSLVGILSADKPPSERLLVNILQFLNACATLGTSRGLLQHLDSSGVLMR
jgi:hypothetical protein